jgi:molybdopterin-biosynthesis enzyme MoeA-like protein
MPTHDDLMAEGIERAVGAGCFLEEDADDIKRRAAYDASNLFAT